MSINFSIILLTLDKSEIGLQLLHRSHDSLLKTGTTLAILGRDGKILCKKDLFISLESGKGVTLLTYFTVLHSKLFGVNIE